MFRRRLIIEYSAFVKLQFEFIFTRIMNPRWRRAYCILFCLLWFHFRFCITARPYRRRQFRFLFHYEHWWATSDPRVRQWLTK